MALHCDRIKFTFIVTEFSQKRLFNPQTFFHLLNSLSGLSLCNTPYFCKKLSCNHLRSMGCMGTFMKMLHGPAGKLQWKNRQTVKISGDS